MSQDQFLPRVEKVFKDVFGRQVPFHAELVRTAEPRWTSLKHVEFIIALESEFNLRFDGADATDMISIPVVIGRISQRLP